MEYKGYIRVSRAILEERIWKNGYDASLYFFLLLHASHNQYGKLMPGQFYSSVTKMAEELGWCRNNVSKHINCLVSQGLISAINDEDSDGKIITVIGWNETCGSIVFDAAQEMRMGVQEMRTGAQEMSLTAQEMRTDAQEMSRGRSQNEHNQIYKNQKDKSTLSPREQAFEEFWKQYPRHEEKSAAKKIWMAMGEPVENLMESLANAKLSKDWLTDDGKFIPKAAKFLDGKWIDYINRHSGEERSAWTEY